MTGIVAEERQAARPLRLASRFLRRAWRVLVVVALAIALAVAAYLSPGLVQADVRLDEGMIYVGKRDQGLVGAINAQIDELTQVTPVGGSAFVVLQHEELLLVHGVESATLTRIEPGRNTVSAPTALGSPNARVQLVGDQLLVLHPLSGRAWFGDANTVLGYDFQKEKAHLEIGEDAVATLTTAGDIVAVDPGRSELVRLVDGVRTATPLPFSLDPQRVSLDISAVGNKAVVLDKVSGRIWVEGMGKAFGVSGASGAALMAPADNALRGDLGAHAIYATKAGLIAVTNDGPKSLTGQVDEAPVIRPIQVAGCVYGGFGTQFVKRCAGEETERRDIPQLPSGTVDLAFSVNRTTVALNDRVTGRSWLVNKDMQVVDNWERVLPQADDTVSELSERDTLALPERSADNRPPVARPDTLRARAGRSSVVPILDNDTDPDGDVLTITAPTEIDGASLQLIQGGSALQITVDPDATGQLTFTYGINDGRTGQDTAAVTVTVVPQDQATSNGEPYPFHLAQPLRTSLGQVIQSRVLLDWRDPDGDPLVLKDAWMDQGSEDFVEFTPDGTLTYYDVGKTTGTKLIHLVVSDGSVDQQGTLQVIVGDELLPPVAHGDYATGTVGEELTVDPLANDVGPITRGRALSLRDVQVIDCADCEVTRNFRDGTFTFRADRIGTYYLLYTVVTGPPANGLVRIDITEPKSNNPPVAALDVVLLPPGGSVMTDPLLNDTDVDRDVLVIQSVSEHPALELVLERRHLLTIKAKFTPDAPVTLTYNLSDGQFITQGTIVVIPTPTTGSVAPQATDDVVRVRAGSTVAADLLRNDSSPIGLDLTLSRVLNSPFGDGIWIDRHRVQIAVPAGTNRQNTFFEYEIVDEEGGTTTARVRVEVIGEDAPNSPPEPRQVIERVIAGSTSPIPIPLDGIDPNGDAVRLVGLGSGPRLGRVVAVGEEYLSYEAYPDSRGTDVFHYAVVDSLGARAVGEIRVGVAQPNPSNLAPVGGHDQVTVRPGRQVQIYALGNDYDIDGDQVAYASASPVEMDDPSITARVVDHRDLVLTAPLDEGTYTGRYAIKDSRGMPGSGRLTLVVDADAPLAPPVARDDTVALEAIADKEWAEIDVRSNDVDPDGATEDLRVEVPPYGAPNDESARVSGDGLVTVPITERMQQIRYVVVDPDGNESSALITVPGREDSVPVLRDPSVVVEAVAGQPLQINVDEYIVGTAGRSVKLTTADNVSSTHGHAKPSGPTAVDFVADPGHVGPASVVFEVSDVVPEGDSSAKTAFVSLKVNVTRAPNAVREQEEDDLLPANLPPTLLVAHPTLHIGPGEGDAVLDLHDLFRDPEGQAVVIDDLRHTAGGVEIVWRLQGTRLLASAHELAERGEFTVLSGYAVDAADGRTPFEVRLEVISSRLDPPTAVPDTFDDLPAGQPHTFDPTINDLSYLRDKTITITGQPRIIAGDGEISREGNLVTITPAEGFSGVLTATYTILDATLDPDRRVEGTIRLTVVAVPGTPSTPYAGTAGDGTISVKYKSGGDGGSPITRRIATATADGLDPVTAECAPESCTIDGVKNGHAWRVSVIERNAVGDSPPSPASQELRPDAKPLPVAKPTTQFGDGQLQIGWTHERVYESAQGGSPIEGYYLRRFDASGTQVGQPLLVPGGASARGYTWTGLTNGEPFTFDVVARNAQFSSDPSPQSDPDWGTGLPSGSAQLNVAAIHDDIGGGFTVTLNRDQVNPNGGDISQFVVTPVTAAGPSPDRAITVAAPFANPISATITGMGQTPTRFSVTATNRAGTAEVGATSEYAVAWPAPALESVTPEVGDGQVRWTVSTNINDPSAVAVEYTTGDGWLPLPADGVVAGLTNGQQYRFQFRAQVGDRTSAVYTVDDPVRPRAPEPAPARLDAATLRLRSATEVAALAVPAANDWIASAGWDPAGYQFCESTTADNCQPRSTSRARILPLGDTSYFRWVYGTGQASEPQAITLGRIAEPTYRAQDGTLSRFSFPYVASGHCTIVARDSDGAAVTTTTVDATGGQLVSAARTLTIPDPASTPEAPLPDIPAPAASVTCSLNDSAYSPSFNF